MSVSSDVNETVGDQIAALSGIKVRLEGKLFEEPSWSIEERGDGCAVTLSATVNGEKTNLTTFYIDLKTMYAFPDDYDYKMILQQTEYPNGIPINAQDGD